MKNKFTKKESELIDLMLENFLTIDSNINISNGFCFKFCNEFNIVKETYVSMCFELHNRDLIKYNEKLNCLTPKKTEIKSFLNNGGMTEYWLRRNKLKYDFNISKTKSWSFYLFLVISVIGGIYSCIKIYEYVCKKPKGKLAEESILQKEEEKEKLNTLVLNQVHIDSLHTPNNLENNKTSNK
ncbi:hypothetical protein [Polaribacter staleyi]|uniref:hypothetical protein n=1 Tax=Polaribacter staleyi TaxID=2022337 RepID=UPI0031BB98E5